MKLKSAFISLWLTGVSLALLYTLAMLWQAPGSIADGLTLLALAPVAVFMGGLFLVPTARTAAFVRYPVVLQGLAIGGLLLVDASARHWLFSAGLGLAGTLVYQLWYSRLPRSHSERLEIGAALPALVFEEGDGNRVSTAEMPGPLLLIFYRGNWCPLCMAQIREVAAQYRELERRGVTTLLVSPQPHDNTRSLAQQFEVPFRFMVDAGHRVARELGLFAEGGTPLGLEVLGYDSDTVFPTVIITDAQQRILFVDQTDNYRVRPEPDVFLKVLDEAGA